jgi:hypothetical protein
MRRAGVALIILGFTLGVSLRIADVASSHSSGLSPVDFLPAILLIGGGFLFFRGGQLAARRLSEQPIPADDRFVLYLRPFRSDPSVATRSLLPVLTAGLFKLLTDVEQLARAVAPFGPTLVIGRPGEGLPRPGAVALYSSDAEWQDLVRSKMSSANLVIIRPGPSAGVQWELARARELVAPRNLLIELRGNGISKYQDIRTRAATAGIELPKNIKRRGGFIRFTGEWKAKYLPLAGPYWRCRGLDQYRRQSTFTLRPVFKRRGVHWTAPAVSKTVLAILALPATFFGILAIAFVATLFR